MGTRQFAKVNDCALPPHLLANKDGDGRTVAHLAAARGDNDVALLRPGKSSPVLNQVLGSGNLTMANGMIHGKMVV